MSNPIYKLSWNSKLYPTLDTLGAPDLLKLIEECSVDLLSTEAAKRMTIKQQAKYIADNVRLRLLKERLR